MTLTIYFGYKKFIC